jgi:hypothetical protein
MCNEASNHRYHMLYRSFLAGFGAGLCFVAAGYGQLASFPKPSYFRETFARPVTKVELQSPARLDDYVVDGKLELSLHS